MKKLMVLFTVLAVTLILALPAMAEVKESAVAPPPDGSQAAVDQPTAVRPTLSDRNPIDAWLAADGWHIRVFVSLPKAVEWSGQQPVNGPFTVGLGGLLCVESDPAIDNVAGAGAVEFIVPVQECGTQDEGCYLWCRPSADGMTAWPWTWPHASRAKNDAGQQIGGYRLTLNADGTFTWPGK